MRRMKLTPLFFLFFLILIQFSCTTIKTPDELIAGFKTELKELESLVSDTGTTAAQIELKSQKLVLEGNALLSRFAKTQKACAPMLKQVVADSEKMQGLSVEEIEVQYHQGKSLPKVEKDFCYEAKEFVVHPATVTVLARTKELNSETRGNMQAEIGELGHHLDNIQILLEVEKAEN